MIRRPPRSTLDRSSAASDVYKRQCPNGSVVKRASLFPSGERRIGPAANLRPGGSCTTNVSGRSCDLGPLGNRRRDSKNQDPVTTSPRHTAPATRHLQVQVFLGFARDNWTGSHLSTFSS